ncbi:MAG: hypothetical protein IKT50_04305 [Clostridia bacterium]|nr:hypothetical protein [Clostridia bacterium]
MNTRVMNILSAKDMVRVMTAYIDTFSKDFAPCKEEFEHAIHMLRREVGDEKVDKLLDAIDRRCEADLIFCGSLGYQANLKNFRDPIARTFLDVDFEDYLRVEVLQNMPQRDRAECEIEEFRLSLTEDQRGVFEAVSSYLVFLELDLTKLAHYAGFMFGNDMLYFTEPGYTANLVLSLRYRDFMEKWFGANFKLWYEDRQGKSEVISA